MTTGSALGHGGAAFLRGKILDVPHWEALAAAFNDSRSVVREACADAEQMNCISEMVVVSDESRGDICVATPTWQRRVESLTTVW